MLTTLLLGGITHHYIAHDLNYCNLINDVGTIQNDYIGVLVGSKKFQAGFIKGKDSACGDILGPMASYNFNKNFSFIIGGYNTNHKKFYDRNIVPITSGEITPIIGLDYKIPLYESNEVTISLDNVISFGILTQGITFTF